MKTERKAARDFLHKCNLPTYISVTKSAKLTPRQKEILDKYIIEDLPVSSIACDLNISENTAEKYLSESYDRIYREIQEKSETNESNNCVTIMEDKK